MSDLNKVLLIGRLTRDPAVRYTASGSAVADFGLAMNRTWTDAGGTRQEEATFVDVVVWARLAEVCAEHLSKGRRVLVEGRLQLDRWEEAGGERRSRLRVVGETVQFLDARGAAEALGGETPTSDREG